MHSLHAALPICNLCNLQCTGAMRYSVHSGWEVFQFSMKNGPLPRVWFLSLAAVPFLSHAIPLSNAHSASCVASTLLSHGNLCWRLRPAATMTERDALEVQGDKREETIALGLTLPPSPRSEVGIWTLESVCLNPFTAVCVFPKLSAQPQPVQSN